MIRRARARGCKFPEGLRRRVAGSGITRAQSAKIPGTDAAKDVASMNVIQSPKNVRETLLSLSEIDARVRRLAWDAELIRRHPTRPAYVLYPPELGDPVVIRSAGGTHCEDAPHFVTVFNSEYDS